MADSITASTIIAGGFEYTDAEKGTTKTLYIKLPNPKEDLNAEQVKEAFNSIITNKILRDPYAQELPENSLATAYIEEQEVTDIDIGIVS